MVTDEHAAAPGRPIRRVPAVDRAVRLLDALRRTGRPQGISELARELALNKATVRDILLTLEHHGLVERDTATARFRLGAGLNRFAAAVARAGEPLSAVARPFLRRLVEQTGETAIVAVLDGARLLIVAQDEPAGALKISAPVGRRLPLLAGAPAKVLLAAEEPTRLAALLGEGALPRFTEHSIVDLASYRTALEAVRRQGYALDDEEFLDGVRAVSAPVRGADGRVVAALTVVGFSTRLTSERLPRTIAAVVGAAAEVSLRLGAPPLAPGGDGQAVLAGSALAAEEPGATLEER
ncbi:MAG: IclR family transcriptional regulator [Chloroflexi bacterium]|nr:IclR family transcriptional regulator [Chloroflexota bacterium]